MVDCDIKSDLRGYAHLTCFSHCYRLPGYMLETELGLIAELNTDQNRKVRENIIFLNVVFIIKLFVII